MATLHKDTSSIYSTNLTSDQIWKVLNGLIYEALAPSIAHSDLGIELGLSCLHITSNAKRKISGLEPDQFLQVCFAELIFASVSPTPEVRLHLFNELMNQGLERNIPYEYAQRCIIYPPDIPFFDTSKHSAFIEFQLELYDKFRNDIVARFHNLTDFSARRNRFNKSQSGLNAEGDEHYNVFVLSLMRAIDKFVPWRGTLASYIQSWFENAKGASSYMVYGDEAFGLSRTMRKRVFDGESDLRNKVVPLSDRENLIPETTEDLSVDLIMKTARLPNATLLFFANGLPYYPRGTAN